MPIIKLDATASTNDFLREVLKETKLDDYTVIWADYQHSGRGQYERSWQSEKGKNLTISVLKLHNDLAARDQFGINRAVSLALLQTLTDLNIPDLTIKWPNDILSGNCKLCGILIENSIIGSRLRHTLIGIGLNVNQMEFEGLPHARSLSQISGKTYDLDALLYRLLSAMKKELSVSDEKGLRAQQRRYEACLYRRGKKVSFVQKTENFDAIVSGVTDTGELLLVREDGQTESYGKGDIHWLTDSS